MICYGMLLGASVLVCFFMFLALLNKHKETVFLKKMEAISSEDRSTLEAFFRLFMLKEGGSYVLFGSKPVSFTTFSVSKGEGMGEAIFRYNHENKILQEGWQVWEKYLPIFESKKFAFKCKKINQNRFEIVLINRDRFSEVVKRNLKHFQMVLGNEIEPRSLLKAYLEKDQSLFGLLHEHHALLGTLLGFGTRNSWLFHETTDLRFEDVNALGKHPLKKIVFPPPRSDKYLLEPAFIEKNHRKCFKLFYLPFFLADMSSEETQQLRKQYVQQQKTIHEAYSKGNFLEVTLRKFCD